MKFSKIIHTDPNRIRGQIVSVIGGGGKTSLIEAIAQELRQVGFKVVVTTTTKLNPLPRVALVLKEHSPNFAVELAILLQENRLVVVGQDYYKGQTLKGLRRNAVPGLLRYGDVVLVEADGCRQRPLKTHKSYEPPIPAASTTVIIVCGARAVGQRLDEAYVHRLDLFARKWNLAEGAVLTPEIIASELLSPQSYLRNVPVRAEVRLFVNQADVNNRGARLLAEHLMARCAHPVYYGSVQMQTLSDARTEYARANRGAA